MLFLRVVNRQNLHPKRSLRSTNIGEVYQTLTVILRRDRCMYPKLLLLICRSQPHDSLSFYIIFWHRIIYYHVRRKRKVTLSVCYTIWLVEWIFWKVRSNVINYSLYELLSTDFTSTLLSLRLFINYITDELLNHVASDVGSERKTSGKTHRCDTSKRCHTPLKHHKQFIRIGKIRILSHSSLN